MDVLDTPAYQQPCNVVSPFLFLRFIHSHLGEFCLLSVRDAVDPVRKNGVSKWFWSIFSNNNKRVIFTDFIWVWNLASDLKEKWYIEWISKRFREDYADVRGKELQKDVQNFTVRSFVILGQQIEEHEDWGCGSIILWFTTPTLDGGECNIYRFNMGVKPGLWPQGKVIYWMNFKKIPRRLCGRQW